jgi:hypothetical protein
MRHSHLDFRVNWLSLYGLYGWASGYRVRVIQIRFGYRFILYGFGFGLYGIASGCIVRVIRVRFGYGFGSRFGLYGWASGCMVRVRVRVISGSYHVGYRVIREPYCSGCAEVTLWPSSPWQRQKQTGVQSDVLYHMVGPNMHEEWPTL